MKGPVMALDALPTACAETALACYHDYQARFHEITQRAPQQFMKRRWADIRDDTTLRVNLYAAVVDAAQQTLSKMLGGAADTMAVWAGAKAAYARRTAMRHDREVAWTFFNSLTRRLFDTVGVNRDIEFIHRDAPSDLPRPTDAVVRSYPLGGPLEPVIRQILGDYPDLCMADSMLETVLGDIKKRVEQRLAGIDDGPSMSAVRIDMLRPVFYRGQGAYLIGRIVSKGSPIPLVLALLHPEGGVTLDALLLDADAVSVVFSYTRSAFHVLADRPGEIVAFLKSILPSKPEVDLFTAIGHFKHGKTVLYRDVCRHTDECREDRFRIAPGTQGMVMLVFDMPGLDMVIKLIRDRFDNPKRTTRQRVMQQYDFVFKHYRVGRLIEAHAFEHLSFDRCWFTDDLLEHLMEEASNTVRCIDDRVIIDHAYLERRVVPLDVFLTQAPAQRVAAAVVDFGNAIKDLAMANIFPGDMLLKNFGVTRHGRVVFYDYDEIVTLTDCNFRNIPQPRTYMEEMADEPWYTVDENDVFPEELSRFLGLSAEHRELFIRFHEDLLTVDFWKAIQTEIGNGIIRHIRPYDRGACLKARA
jgi:isocitrate dehydrogenase kinase/phosphatase